MTTSQLAVGSDPVLAVHARSQIADACRGLAASGLVVGSAGNLSVRVEGGTDGGAGVGPAAGPLVAITATGARFDTITPDEVTVVDLAGQVVDGAFAPTSELDLHLGIYRQHGAGAVVHTHPPVGTALSCVLDELPAVHYQLLALGGPVRVAPYATFGTRELADAVVAALADRRGALMANHGAVTYADTLDQAVELSVTLEWVCTVYWRAAAVGTPRVLDAAAQAAAGAAFTARRYSQTHPVD